MHDMSEEPEKVREWVAEHVDSNQFASVLRETSATVPNGVAFCFETAEALLEAQYTTLTAFAYEEGGRLAEQRGSYEKAFMGYANAGLYRHWTGAFAPALELFQRAERSEDVV